MRKFLLSLLWTLTLLFCFSRNQQSGPAALLQQFRAAEKIYRSAERQSELAGDNEQAQAGADSLYKQSLVLFRSILQEADQASFDSLSFFTRRRTGYIEYLFGHTGNAKQDYLDAIRLKEKLPGIADSFLFAPLLYAGSILYSQNSFDSALFYYKKAEQVKDLYPVPLQESQRLYNRLGVMYYENGDYRQARNYFEKAISVTPPGETSLLVNYRINIASLLVKLDEQEAAKKAYESILPYNIFNNEIYHNLGIISLKQKNYQQAIAYLGRVKYGDDKKNIDLYYNLGMAYSGLNQPDSSEQYLLRALAENLKWNGHKKNTSYGLILKYQADEMVRRLRYSEALDLYQQALMQFDAGFTETDTRKNPAVFTAVYSYINLFNTLTAKADAQQKIYEQGKKTEMAEQALDSYRAAFRLADYVEKTYNSDEARLFLGRIKYAVHSRPIEIGLLLYRLTHKREYLEEVYFFDQRNKASVLSLNIRQQELKTPDEATNELNRRETMLKSAITRLSLRASVQTDSLALSELNDAIRDNEIELNKVREKISAGPAGKLLMTGEQIPAINQLQRKFDNNTALLSFHLSEEGLLVLVISANRFDYYEAPLEHDFFTALQSLKSSLYIAVPGKRYEGQTAAAFLYEKLIAPVLPGLSQIKRLVIIPDDELYYLPFEALQDEQKNYLVQRFAIQYQYSTALISDTRTIRPSSQILSFAPFNGNGFSDSAGTLWSRLPASAGEVNIPLGKNLTDSAATKQAFLDNANHYNIIHLATHAAVNNEDPLRSYIAFFPDNPDYRLYAREIYDMRLDSTSLVILSACETGTGELIRGEGLMSLSRAFAYAGCPNIITSLWKAEDSTTAWITQKLHEYLARNYTKDVALQQARLDFLNSNEIDPRFKTPDYWAHLVLIGNYEPDHKRSNWPWVAVGIVAILLTYYYFKSRKPPAPKDRSAGFA